MTPNDVVELFANGYCAGTKPIDDVTAELAIWMSAKARSLSEGDRAVLCAVGSVLFERAIAEKLANPKYAEMAAAALIDALRRQK